jgi:hypothetical protein
MANAVGEEEDAEDAVAEVEGAVDAELHDHDHDHYFGYCTKYRRF